MKNENSKFHLRTTNLPEKQNSPLFLDDIKMHLETISQVMIRDHNKIENLLNDLGKCIDLDKQTLIKVFEKFKWELEKHLFTEEKVIFSSYEPENQLEGYTMIPQLMKEHDKIYKKLRGIKKDIKYDKKCDFQDFKELIIKHKDFEENFLYPILDQELDVTTKKMIIKRIKEIKLEDSGLKNIKVKCSECGKKLGILEGYYYPKFDRRWLFCKNCYNMIEEKDKEIARRKGGKLK